MSAASGVMSAPDTTPTSAQFSRYCTRTVQLAIAREERKAHEGHVRSTDENVARLVDEPHGAANALRDVHHEDLVARRVADRVQNVGAHRHVPIAVRLEHEAAQRRFRERADLWRKCERNVC